jgi:hypothetical protein
VKEERRKVGWAATMGSQEQHALALLENLRRLYETEDCFLSDVTLLARDGQIKGREACR